jgi:signal transduction histidine kinase
MEGSFSFFFGKTMISPNTTTPIDQLQDIVSAMVHAAEAESIEQVLQRISKAACKLMNVKYAALGITDSNGLWFSHFEVFGMTEEQIARIGHRPIGGGLLGAVMSEKHPIIVDTIQDDPRSEGFPDGHPPMTTFLGVPVKVGKQLLGILYLTEKEDGSPFDRQKDLWLAETIARYAALAIAGIQLREHHRRLALLEERQRIAMELHDGVIQSLYALGMQIDLLRSSERSTSDDFQPTIDGLNIVIEDIRSYIMDLKPDSGKGRTVYQLLTNFVSRLYIPDSISVTVDAPDMLPPFTSADFESICFIAGEALSNAIRHSNARNISIQAWQDAYNFRVIVKDDGQGFAPDKLKNNNGLGLHNMRERVHMHSGKLVIDSILGNGTQIKVAIPTNSSK